MNLCAIGKYTVGNVAPGVYTAYANDHHLRSGRTAFISKHYRFHLVSMMILFQRHWKYAQQCRNLGESLATSTYTYSSSASRRFAIIHTETVKGTFVLPYAVDPMCAAIAAVTMHRSWLAFGYTEHGLEMLFVTVISIK